MASEDSDNVENEYYEGGDGNIDNKHSGEDNDDKEGELQHSLVEVEAEADDSRSWESSIVEGSIVSYDAELEDKRNNITVATRKPGVCLANCH